ncbi:DNA-binding transcriptional LysR family regulator [Roseiarcus fermentans]|uniref:DNA-binding transcriptional LysR family regulator n=1 Tax=Roseiarcus fermentans TaxID=1473586 RepID=A0A366FPK1_9HYPH|nr:LysR substrate-binding domain-containing protein [Roseiarcus fermentans]RBP16491.1 DNA-binding transcriptional LysR family regulator [Roseiarcus fermentans]
MLDTDQLRSFLAIVDTGSFTKAADRVHKTQSAVSMHVRRLEEQLGCALFVKQGRGTRLTAEGESLIDFARRIVHIEAGAVAALSRKGLRGAVRLGIPDDYAETYLAAILGRFTRKHPMVEVSVACEGSPELAQQVSVGALELALVTDHPGLHGFELLHEQPLVWAASERFHVDAGAPIPLALGAVSCLWRREADDALAEAERQTRGLVFSKNFSAIGAVVRAGLAATTLPESMVGEGLRMLGPEEGLPPLPPTRMGLIHAAGHPSEETKALANAIRETISLAMRRAA